MRRALLLITAIALSGCASIIRGSHQEVHVETAPTGADVYHEETRRRWSSPASSELARNSRHVLLVEAQGYRSQEVYIRSEASVAWWIIDAFSLGIGNALDAAIGGLFNLKPERVYVVLEPEDVDAAAKHP